MARSWHFCISFVIHCLRFSRDFQYKENCWVDPIFMSVPHIPNRERLSDKLHDHLFSSARGCLFTILAVTLQVWKSLSWLTGSQTLSLTDLTFSTCLAIVLLYTVFYEISYAISRPNDFSLCHVPPTCFGFSRPSSAKSFTEECAYLDIKYNVLD